MDFIFYFACHCGGDARFTAALAIVFFRWNVKWVDLSMQVYQRHCLFRLTSNLKETDGRVTYSIMSIKVDQ